MSLHLPRDYRDLIESEGLEIVEFRQRKHFVVRVRNAHGVESSLTLSGSTSDHRARANQKRDARRAARKLNQQEPEEG